MIKKRKVLQYISPWLFRDEIIIISGPRRVGKTTILQLIENELLSKGVDEKNIFILNLEDIDVLKSLSKSPKELLKYLIQGEKKTYFLIDEIQYLEEPSNFLKYLFDLHRDKIKLIVTGSFLFEAKGQFKDSLVGRKISFQITPLTFDEFTSFRNEKLQPFLSAEDVPDSIKNDFLYLLEEYLIFGGMPEVVLTPGIEMKKMLLKEYVNSYLKRDIRYISASNDILRYNDLLSIISNQLAGLLNLEEISNTLGLPRKKVEKYLGNFVLSDLIYLIPPFYTNIRTQISKMKKVFLFDVGVRNQVIQNFNEVSNRNDSGAIFENFILNELINSYGKENVFYFRTKTGTEIDFIIKNRDVIPIEVKYKKLTKSTGVRALAYFIEKNKIKSGYLLNLFLNQALSEKKIKIIDFLNFIKLINRTKISQE